MSKKFRVSQSKVKTWRRCHMAYHRRYVEELRKKRKSRPLQFGTMIHEALEMHFNGDEALDYFDILRDDVKAMKLFAQERDEYGDILQDCEDIITDYLDYWDDRDLRAVRIKGQGAEHLFEIEILPDVIWNGKLDVIAKTPNKLRWLVEHKTYTRKPNDDARWRDLQSSTYFRANDILGWPQLDGCLWDYVKSKPPAIPELLKDGSFSTKKIDTLPSTVLRTLSENSEAQEKSATKQLQALRTMAENNRSQYFQRIHTPVNSDVAELVFNDFEASVREMIEGHGKCSDMNIDKHCSWCDYEPLCRATLQGLDVDYVKEREYTNGDTKPETKAPIHKKNYSEVKRYYKNS